MGLIAPALVVFVTAFLAQRLVQQQLIVPSSVELWPCKPDETGETMRAIAYNQHGSASVLELYPAYPRPVPKANQVLVRVHASSINPCDFKFRRNPAPNFLFPKPKIVAQDLAGTIVHVGSSAVKEEDSWKVGDRVAAMLPLLMTRWGSAAEWVAVDASLLARVPDDHDNNDDDDMLENAAALPLVATTVVQALQQVAVRGHQDYNWSDKRILIHAGGGGLGTFAIQYAKHVLGMKYVATTASKEKEDLLRELGADLVIDYRTVQFEDVIQDYDVVFDSMSWAYQDRTLNSGSKVLKPTGHYLNIASSDWAWDGSEKTNILKSMIKWIKHTVLNLIRPGLVPRYSFVAVTPDGKVLQHVMDLLGNSTIRAIIDRRFPMEDARAAFEYLEQGHATGKVILYNGRKQEDLTQ